MNGEGPGDSRSGGASCGSAGGSVGAVPAAEMAPRTGVRYGGTGRIRERARPLPRGPIVGAPDLSFPPLEEVPPGDPAHPPTASPPPRWDERRGRRRPQRRPPARRRGMAPARMSAGSGGLYG